MNVLILKEELNIKVSKSPSPNKVTVFEIEDLFTVFRDKQIFESTKNEIIATTENGETCGIRKKVGDGTVTILGFAFGYTSDEHLHLYEKIVFLDGIKRAAKISDPDIQFVIRKGEKYSYLFLLNYHNQKKSFSVGSKDITLSAFSCKVIKQK